MERLALVYRVKPEKKDEYIKAHREIWPEIENGLKDAGCREMIIFIREELLFLYAVVKNVEEFNRIRELDPFYQRWNKWMHELLVHPFDENEQSAFAPLEEIWRFDADLL